MIFDKTAKHDSKKDQRRGYGRVDGRVDGRDETNSFPLNKGIPKDLGRNERFFRMHTKKSAIQKESAYLCAFSLDGAKGEFVGTKLRLCYRQTHSLVPTNSAEGKGWIFMQITEYTYFFFNF